MVNICSRLIHTFTCDSVIPNAYASFARSGPARYLVCSNVFSNAKICWPLNVGRVCFFLPSLSEPWCCDRLADTVHMQREEEREKKEILFKIMKFQSKWNAAEKIIRTMLIKIIMIHEQIVEYNNNNNNSICVAFCVQCSVASPTCVYRTKSLFMFFSRSLSPLGRYATYHTSTYITYCIRSNFWHMFRRSSDFRRKTSDSFIVVFSWYKVKTADNVKCRA